MKRRCFFLSVCVSFPLIHTHISGFLPRCAVAFFTLCFDFLPEFLERLFVAFALLAVAIAAMIYSKYHAFW